MVSTGGGLSTVRDGLKTPFCRSETPGFHRQNPLNFSHLWRKHRPILGFVFGTFGPDPTRRRPAWPKPALVPSQLDRSRRLSPAL